MSFLLVAWLLAQSPPALAEEDPYLEPEERARVEAARDLPELTRYLRNGDWNSRIYALQRVSALGPDAVPLLDYATQDLDWQVRLTAVHWLGRQGAAGIPALARTMREEPCRIVRLTALHWLGSLGPEAIPVLQAADGDDSAMLRTGQAYWLKKLKAVNADGRAPDPDDRMVLAGAREEDLRECRSVNVPKSRDEPPIIVVSAGSGPAPEPEPVRPVPKPRPKLRPGPEEFPEPRPYAPPEPRKAPLKEFKEVDRFLALDFLSPSAPERKPQTLPPGPPSGSRRASPTEEPAATAPARTAPAARLAARKGLGEPESFPKGPPGPAPRAKGEDPWLALAPHAAPAKGHDPLPDLLKSLASEDRFVRYRAADELGRMGNRAASAVPNLAHALKDPADEVRASAALALGNVGPAADPAVPLLAELLADPVVDIRSSAAIALGRIGTPASEKAFHKHLRSEAEGIITQDKE